jgi:aspartyl-tRNA(Asn)/glutamyl-tRNA(Gln) amidotransferase subunit A
MSTLPSLAADLAAGHTTSTQLVEECLLRIKATDGEGELTFLEVHADEARQTAKAMDELRTSAAEPSPYAGIPISVKDLFDVRGQVTRAGSRVLDQGPAGSDATTITRARQAGLIILGRTNMTEFAFSGLGINPHYGTPANPWDRRNRRIPGGSSSGAAVSISDGMAYGALGTDTGGSCRIPAALCGIVGFKPTQSRIPRDGVVPLSQSLDAVGVLANSVACCSVLDAILSGDDPTPTKPLARPPRLAVPRNYFNVDAEERVLLTFERTIRLLRDAGAELTDIELPELEGLPEMNSSGGFPAAESFTWHHDLISRNAGAYDPRVLARIRRGELQTARDLLVLQERRQSLIENTMGRLEGFDAFVCPTVPLIAPPLDVFENDDAYTRINLLMLRNPTVVNLLDGTALSVPMHNEEEPPMGLMVAGLAGHDRQVLRIGAWIEEVL